MNRNRWITRNAFAIALNIAFLWTWIPIGDAAVTAERTLPQWYFLQGQQKLTIRIQITGEADSVMIHETIPPGWTVYRADNATVNDRTLSWELTSFSGSSYVLCYVNAPETAEEDAQFSGTINGDPIGGDQVMEFRAPVATPGKQVPIYGSIYITIAYIFLPTIRSKEVNGR